MASKLRRTPLFGYDGNLGIPIIPQQQQQQQQPRSSTTDPKIKMEVVSSNTSSNPSRYGQSSKSSQHNSNSSQSSTPQTPNKHVNFGNQGPEEKKREKFLTAKYGAHQMALIRKRLRVEMWMYERLQEIYGADNIEIDLDEVLDMDDESDRRTYISELLQVDGSPLIKPDRVNLFVGDLLEKVKTL